MHNYLHTFNISWFNETFVFPKQKIFINVKCFYFVTGYLHDYWNKLFVHAEEVVFLLTPTFFLLILPNEKIFIQNKR